jgi:hypothetical protein
LHKKRKRTWGQSRKTNEFQCYNVDRLNARILSANKPVCTWNIEAWPKSRFRALNLSGFLTKH